ncbi:MAG: hypothetical protein M1391_17680 [Bacteroidetes bacterium]|nr:hypothetical protein [Bacteroidota bacterium]
MNRYSINSRSGIISAITLLLVLSMLVATRYFVSCDTTDYNPTSKNQCVNTNNTSDEYNFAHHFIALADPTTSDEDIIDYNDIHKVYKLFNTASLHKTIDCLDITLNSENLEQFNCLSNNFSAHEKTIRLRSILI